MSLLPIIRAVVMTLPCDEQLEYWYWYSVMEHGISYKILLLTYKALNGHAPQYLAAFISKYVPPRPLRSEDQYLLKSPRWRLETFGKRAFPRAVPTMWNPLTLSVKHTPSIDSFKIRLKTFLFNDAFWWPVCVIPWPVHDEHYKEHLSIASRHA